MSNVIMVISLNRTHYALMLLGAAAILMVAVMPMVTSASVEKVSAFVCPVIENEAVGEHNPQASPLGDTGDYTVVPATANNGNLKVPVHATNGNGAGIPGGDHSGPGDTDYTAIWAK